MLHNFCEGNSTLGIDEEDVQAQIPLHRNQDKITRNTPGEVYSHNSTEGENIREILIYTQKFAGQLQHLRNKILYPCSYEIY